MDHVEGGQVDAAGMRQPVMVAGAVLDGEAVAFGHELAVAEREIGGRVVEHVVPAPLRLEQEREGRIAPDIDALDRVHLEGDLEGHGDEALLLVGLTLRDGPLALLRVRTFSLW